MAVKMSEIPEDLRDLFDEKKPGRNAVKASSVRKGTVKKMALPRDTDKFVLDNGLTPTQEAYARARAFGMTQQEAMYFATNGRVKAVGAGSSMESEYPLVRKRINELSIQVAERVVESAAASKAWVMKRLMQVADRCMQAEPVLMFNRSTGEYEETGEYKFDSAGANRSLELIGKELGMFVDRKEIRHGAIGAMTDAELENTIAKLSQELGIENPLALPAPGQS